MKEYTDYKLKSGNILRVLPDRNADSPNEWQNTDIFLVYEHNQFTVKRDGFHPKNIYNYLNDRSEPKLDDYDDYFIFLVYAYIHSGISLSLDNATKCPWDVSTTGYILVKKSIVTPDKKSNTKWDAKELAKEHAEGLIKTWNQYLSGDMYGFQVLKLIKTYTITEEDFANLIIDIEFNRKDYEIIRKDAFLDVASIKIEQKEIDSCWDFYGDNPRENGMLDNINDEIIEEVKI